MEQHTLTIDENRIENTIYIDHATRVPNNTDPPPRAQEMLQNANNAVKNTNKPTLRRVNAQQPRSTTDKLPSTDAKSHPHETSSLQEYVLDRIVRRIEKPPNVKNIVRWYGYDASRDNLKPAENVPQQFDAMY